MFRLTHKHTASTTLPRDPNAALRAHVADPRPSLAEILAGHTERRVRPAVRPVRRTLAELIDERTG